MILPTFVYSKLDPRPFYTKRVKKIQKPDGTIKIREQFKPNESLKFVHRFAKSQIQERLDALEISFSSATAFVRGSGMNKHFLRHVNNSGLFNQYWFVTDLEKAYKSVDTETLIDLLRQLFMIDPNPYRHGSSEWLNLEHFFWEFPPPLKSKFSSYEMRAYLSDLFLNPETYEGLAEGYSASPFLFNLYCEFVIDRPLRELCKKWQITYSRYADDLFFSSDIPIGKVKRKKIKKIIAKWFSINQQKTQFFDINDYPQGVVLNKCLARNNKGQAEILILNKGRKEFERLVHAIYMHGMGSREKVAGKHGALQQKTQFFGRGEPSPPKGLKKSLTLYRLYGNLKKGDAIVAKNKQ